MLHRFLPICVLFGYMILYRGFQSLRPPLEAPMAAVKSEDGHIFSSQTYESLKEHIYAAEKMALEYLEITRETLSPLSDPAQIWKDVVVWSTTFLELLGLERLYLLGFVVTMFIYALVALHYLRLPMIKSNKKNVTIAASDVTSHEAKTFDVKTLPHHLCCDFKRNDVKKSDAKVGDAKADDANANDAKAGDAKARDVNTIVRGLSELYLPLTLVATRRNMTSKGVTLEDARDARDCGDKSVERARDGASKGQAKEVWANRKNTNVNSMMTDDVKEDGALGDAKVEDMKKKIGLLASDLKVTLALVHSQSIMNNRKLTLKQILDMK